MARIQILTLEEVTERDAKPQGMGRVGRRRRPEREEIIAFYKELLEPTGPGYGGDVELEEGEDKRIVRQNLQFAAQELERAIEFRPIKNKMRIHFRIITQEQKEAKPKRGGGRPKKKVA
jgi:hypothetical protein